MHIVWYYWFLVIKNDRSEKLRTLVFRKLKKSILKHNDYTYSFYDFRTVHNKTGTCLKILIYYLINIIIIYNTCIRNFVFSISIRLFILKMFKK